MEYFGIVLIIDFQAPARSSGDRKMEPCLTLFPPRFPLTRKALLTW